MEAFGKEVLFVIKAETAQGADIVKRNGTHYFFDIGGFGGDGIGRRKDISFNNLCLGSFQGIGVADVAVANFSL